MKLIIISLISLLTVGVAFFIGLIMLQGSANGKTLPCSLGQCIMTADGSERICPKTPTELMTPNYRYGQCVDLMSCPTEGTKYAVHRDGSAFTNICEDPGCECSLYRRCPAYILSIFRLLGVGERRSYFEVIDPLYDNKATNPDAIIVPNPYSPPYTLNNTTDECFITKNRLTMIYPPLEPLNPCLRGIFAEIASKPGSYGCVPEKFVNKTTMIFDDTSFLKNYTL